MSGNFCKFALRNANAKIVRNNHNIKSLASKDNTILCKDPFFSLLQPDDPSTSAGSDLSVVCRRDDYSASRIARACEDVDAQLLALSVGRRGGDCDDGILHVDLHIDLADATAAARSLERYGYRVVDLRHEGGVPAADGLSERIDGLLALLNV